LPRRNMRAMNIRIVFVFVLLSSLLGAVGQTPQSSRNDGSLLAALSASLRQPQAPAPHVAGTGGINDQAIVAGNGTKTGDHVFVKSLKGYGYLLIEAQADARGNATTLVSTMFQVDTTTKKKSQFDQVTVNLANNTVH